MNKAFGIGAVTVLVLGVTAYVFLFKKDESIPLAKVDAGEIEKDTSPAVAKADQEMPLEEIPMEQDSKSINPATKTTKTDRVNRPFRNDISKGHFEITTMRNEGLYAVDKIWFGKVREQKLWDLFQAKDSELARHVKVQSIQCTEAVCTVVAESKDGNVENFHASLFAIIDNEPWVGNKIDVTTFDDIGLRVRSIFFHEFAK